LVKMVKEMRPWYVRLLSGLFETWIVGIFLLFLVWITIWLLQKVF